MATLNVCLCYCQRCYEGAAGGLHHSYGCFAPFLPCAHAQRGKVIGFVVAVVVVVVSTKITRSGILGEFASAICSYGVGNRKKTRVRASRLSKRDHETYTSCFLLVTPISHTHNSYLHMHTARSRTRTLAIASAISCTFAHGGYRSIFAGSMNDSNC